MWTISAASAARAVETSSTATLTAAGPKVELPPPEEQAPPPLRLGADRVEDTVLVRGLQEARFQGGRTVIGGYGEVNLDYLAVGPESPFEGTASVRRLVLFVAHNFSEDARAYAELEWENAIACSSCEGAVEVEQAYLEWRLLPELSLKGGLLLVPMGIINQWHEPTVYHGVERPSFDQLLIPTTWRELGVGATGKLLGMAQYELYLMTAPDPLAMGSAGLAGASTEGSLSPANSWMLSGRFELEPLLGVVLGASGVAGDLGGGSRFFDAQGEPASLTLPLLGASLDARWRRSGLEARAVAASFYFPKAKNLLESRREDGSPHFPDPARSGVVPLRSMGVLMEVAYDVLRLATATEQQLLPFVRFERYDLQSRVPAGFAADPALAVSEWTLGLSYRPIQQIVAKLAYVLRNRQLGLDEAELDLGLGYMF